MTAHANLPSYTSMEILIQQITIVVRQWLHKELGTLVDIVFCCFTIITWTLVETLLESYFKSISAVKSAPNKLYTQLANSRNS